MQKRRWRDRCRPLLACKHQMHSARAWETPTDVVHAGARANGAQEKRGEVLGGGVAYHVTTAGKRAGSRCLGIAAMFEGR